MPRKPLPTKRAAVPLSAKLDKNLFAYAAAASATGVSILALAQPSQARIIYTPAHEQVQPKVFLDLNHDGIKDFKVVFQRSTLCQGSHCTSRGILHGTQFTSTNASLNLYGAQPANQVVGTFYASELPAGVPVGSSAKFPGGKEMVRVHGINGSNFVTYGPWGAVAGGINQGYLGLKFVINGETHFGWARFKLDIQSSAITLRAVLTGYAYETVPNKPIITGKQSGGDESAPSIKPAALGSLARGAAGLEAWRKDQK